MFCFCLSKPQAWHIITARSAVHIISPKGLYIILLARPPFYTVALRATFRQRRNARIAIGTQLTRASTESLAFDYHALACISPARGSMIYKYNKAPATWQVPYLFIGCSADFGCSAGSAGSCYSDSADCSADSAGSCYSDSADCSADSAGSCYSDSSDFVPS